MSWAGGFFGGSSPVLNAGITKAGDTSTYATNTGKNLSTQAGNFWSDLMSGDPSKTAKLLSPQIRTQQAQGQQMKQGMSQFGTRSGGTAAKGQTIDDTTRANIGNMIAQLTGSAAGAATSMGKDMLDLGMQSLNQQVSFSQQQMQNWQDSLMGQGMSQGLGFLEGKGLSGMMSKFGMPPAPM
jgi:hypothetical protein